MNQRLSVTPAKATADNDLTDSEYRTLAVIGIFSNPEGWCWPSQSTLADLRGVSRKTINLHIKRLIELGYLNIHARYDEETGAQKSNMMQIKFDFPPNVTGGVTPKTLQGGSHPIGYTPPNTQDVTHNAPINTLTNAPIYNKQPRTPEPPIEYIPEPVQRIITELSSISKTAYWVKTEDAYRDAAYALYGMDGFTIDKLPGFAQWWSANGYYPGRPALKTILDEWKSYTSGVKRQATKANGPMTPAPESERVGGLY